MKKYLLQILLLITGFQVLSAQQGIVMQFLNKNTTESVSEIARNRIKIVNNTTNTYPFLLNFKVPPKWKLLGMQSRTFILAPNDSVFVPVYMIPDKNIQGGDYAVLGAELFSDGFLVNNDNWILTVERLSNWHIQPESNQIYFLHGRDTADLKFYVINQGNATEDLLFDLNAFRDKLTLYDDDYNIFRPEDFSLKSGKDTVLNFHAVINRKFEGENTYNTLRKKPNREIYNIRAEAHNKGDDHLYAVDKENITLNKVSDYYQENRYGSASLPLVVQLDAYNILEQSTYLSFQAYGNKTINEVNELSYFYQTNFNSNVLNADAFLGDYFFVGYNAPKYYAELGNLVLNHEGASVSGKGVRGGYRAKGHEAGGGIVASPDMFEIERWGGSLYYKYNYAPRDLNAAVYSFYEENSYNNQQNITVIPESSWRINNNHMVRLMMGYNMRTYLFNAPGRFTRNGYGTRLSYGGRFNRFTFSATGRYGTPTYEPSPGITQLSGITGFYHQSGLQSRLLVSHFSSRPDIYDVFGNLVQQGLRSRTNQAEYKLSASQRMNTFSGSLYARERFYNSLQMVNEGVGVSYYRRFEDNSRISASLNTDVNQFPELIGFGSFFSARLKTSYRYRSNLLVNLRYHYGPFYYYEFSEYAQSRENPQTIFLNGYYDLWMAKNRLLARFSGNYNYRLVREQHIFNTRPELFWYSKTGFRFSFYSNISYFSRQQQFINQPDSYSRTSSKNLELGFGVRKELGIPVSGKRFFDVQCIAFYDENGNGIKEKNEKGLTNVLVSLIPAEDKGMFSSMDGYKILTGAGGEGLLENITKGNYTIVVQKLTKGDGFYNNSVKTVALFKDEIVYLPFTSGGKIMGTLQVQKAKYTRFSEKDVELSNIRIVATDMFGNEYSTLTDQNGFFKIEVPGGKFTVSINSAVFGAGFSVQENDIEVEINDINKSVFVNFLISEQERRMNIKKF
ncbi:hypothetical protein [Saccharicrinis sp. FJH54]|uniref:hypothetical protein n=1 Tax=Saccharicrinis sp. FJH54 TaxID=3344665 RepID=UPI0035D49845